MKSTLGVVAIVIACSSSVPSQGYSNGPFITHQGVYVCAGGADGSALEPNLQYAGFNASVAFGARLADDFTVPAGQSWPIHSITAFAYETGSSTMSTLSAANYRIWNGQPGAGGSIIHNYSASTQLTSSSWTGVYREAIAYMGVCPTGTMRPVMRAVMGGNGIVLSSGTYWLDIQVGGTPGVSQFVPPITILGTPTTGNARQFNGTSWVAMSSNGYVQGVPFEFNCLPASLPGPWQTNTPEAGLSLNGLQNTATSGPIDVAMCTPGTSQLGIQSSLPGMGWDLVITASAGVAPVACPSTLTTPGNQVINVDLGHPSLTFLNGFALPPFAANLQLPIVDPPVIPVVAAQFFIIDPGHLDGVRLSALNQLRVSPTASLGAPLAGPGSDDSAVTVNVGCLPFYGTNKTRMFVISNGRVTFDTASTSSFPNVGSAQINVPFVGPWCNLNPASGGSITISSPLPGQFLCDYSGIPYSNLLGPNSFSILLDAGTGIITLDGLLGLAPGGSASQFIGLSRGFGATDPGMAPFAAGAAGAATNASDMLYRFGTAGSVAPGVNRIEFTPITSGAAAGNYSWAAFNP